MPTSSRLHRIRNNASVGGGVPDAPFTAPLVNTMSLRDQFANWSWQSAFPSLKALFAAHKKGPASRQDPLSVSKCLAEFAARRRQRNKIIFSRDMCVRENTARAASVEFVRHRRTNYARSRLQAFCRKNPEGFSTVEGLPLSAAVPVFCIFLCPLTPPAGVPPSPRKSPTRRCWWRDRRCARNTWRSSAGPAPTPRSPDPGRCTR